MRWDELFADLSAQRDAEDAAELAGEVAETSRWEAGRLSLPDRLRGWPAGTPMRVGLAGGAVGAGEVRGPLLAVGHDWLAVGEAPSECLVPIGAVRWLRPDMARTRATCSSTSGPRPSQPGGAERLRLAQAVRLLARDRAYVRVGLVDGVVVGGTVDRVGPDHLDLAAHPGDVPRRDEEVQSLWLVPYLSVASIRGGRVWSGQVWSGQVWSAS